MVCVFRKSIFYAAASCAIVVASASAAAASDSFRVAEVKPHFGCKSTAGQDRVRQYIANLATAGTGLITLLETEFTLPQPIGYTAFGAACGRHFDPAIVLVNEAQFSVVSTMGATISGNYSKMPYIGGGQAPAGATNAMCSSDPEAMFPAKSKYPVGSRPYSGAVLLHKASGKEICIVVGTLAHCLFEWTDQFMADVDKTCGNRQLLIVGDTNAGCEIPTLRSDSHWHFDEILANHSKAEWGPCHDPGFYKEPTCCNDFPQWPYPRYQYDRTVACRGGRVADFKIEDTFVCGDSRAEHLFTTATVYLAMPENLDSEHCLDHPACAALGFVYHPDGTTNQVLPADGLCCPTGAGKMRLPCCNATVTAAAVQQDTLFVFA
jgi:hypothetical protein